MKDNYTVHRPISILATNFDCFSEQLCSHEAMYLAARAPHRPMKMGL